MLASVEVYKKIAPKLGEQEASDLIVFIEDTVKQAAVTKADLERTARELENNFNNKLATVETNLRKEIADVRKEVADIRKEVADIRKEVSDLRGLLIKFILPMSSIIGAIAGAIIQLIAK